MERDGRSSSQRSLAKPAAAHPPPPPHVLVLPFPSQGHINPMHQFAKQLVFKGLEATLITTVFISKSIKDIANDDSPSLVHVGVESISDGFDDDGFGKAESIDSYLKTFETVGSRTLTDLLKKTTTNPPCCIIYDSVLPWALDVAKEFQLYGAPFFTQSCIVNSIYYHLGQLQNEDGSSGSLSLSSPIRSLPISAADDVVSIMSGLIVLSTSSSPPLQLSDMPSFVNVPGSYPAYLDLVLKQYINIDKADWIFVNTFRELEAKVAERMAQIFPQIRMIGPTIPSMYLDKRIKGDKDYGFNLYRPSSSLCMNWLNSKPIGSVVYVSFGSMASLDQQQMEELAMGLMRLIGTAAATTTNLCYSFLWVIRESEEKTLPKDLLEQLLSREGSVLVVRWCPQLEVLAHEAVGCFVSHCGWNSTLEALSLGVPIVGIPQWTDQTTDAKLVQDVWGIGVLATKENGIATRIEIERCVRQVMEGTKAEEIKENAGKWRELAQRAMDAGGSSDTDIKEFVTKLIGVSSM